MLAYQKQKDYTNKLVEVGGRKTLLKGFEEFDFFYYKNDVTEIYHIVEKSTGMSVGTGYRLDDTRENAFDKLTKVGVDKFQKIVADELAKREVQNGDYVEGQPRKLRPEEMPTDMEVIKAQDYAIKGLQKTVEELIDKLPTVEYVKKLEETIASLRVIIAQLSK